MNSGWFILNSQSGKEDVVLEVIEKKQKEGLLKFVKETVVATHKEIVFKEGKKKVVNRKSYPGYIYVNMEMNMENKKEMISLPYVICFVQERGKIIPEPLEEVDYIHIVNKKDDAVEVDDSIVYIDHDVGEKVLIIDGALNGFTGVVNSIHKEKRKLMVDVEIFGRVTPVEIDYFKVKKA